MRCFALFFLLFSCTPLDNRSSSAQTETDPTLLLIADDAYVDDDPQRNSVLSLSSILQAPRPDWIFYVRDNGIPPWTGEKLQNAMSIFTLGASTLIPAGERPVEMIGEWDYSFQRIPNGSPDGSGVYRQDFPCFNDKQGCERPTSEEEALRRLQLYYRARVKQLSGNPLILSVTGHFFYQHRGAEWGAQLVLSEVGENIISTQAHIAFTRGAARQYHVPWGMDMSSWFGPSIRDYSSPPVWKEPSPGPIYSSPTGGHSLSLTKRIYFASYMAGANFFMDEAGSVNFFDGEALSPLGKVAQDFNQFTVNHPDRGTPYVPIAILMDRIHGMGLSWWESTSLNWDTFPIDENDRSRLYTKSLFEAIWPLSFSFPQDNDESRFLVASPFGDSFDVLLENAPTTLFSHYRVIIATGHLANDPALIAALRYFVEAGGILILDPTTYGQYFISGTAWGATPVKFPGATTTDYYSVGLGSVVVVNDLREWTPVLTSISSQVLPFKVDGSVEFMFNKKGTRWVVTLLNNKGVTKRPKDAEVVDPQAAQTVTVQAKSGNISNIVSWRGSDVVQINSNSFLTTIGPGDVAVYEFETTGAI